MTRPCSGETASVEELTLELEQNRARLNAAKIAYLNGTEFDGSKITYERLKDAATAVINTSYALQKLQYGSIKLRLSVAKLLRRGG